MTRPLAIVTGGSRGIGAACVQALHRDGFNVAFTYVSSVDAAQRLEVPQHVKAYALDIRDIAAVKQTFTHIIADFGTRPHVVVVNAGMNLPYLPIGQFSHDSFRQIMETNLFGAFNVLYEAAHAVLDGGSIIGMTTSLVRHAAAGTGAYTASKAGVEALIRSMAKELAVRNIRVNAVAPGSVDTELFHHGKTDEAKARSAALSPFNRIGTTAEVAEVVSFLASNKASWVHGQVIQPNGGMV
jgi:3-oxoacyl-[acyl-carrier protein] reductase